MPRYLFSCRVWCLLGLLMLGTSSLYGQEDQRIQQIQARLSEPNLGYSTILALTTEAFDLLPPQDSLRNTLLRQQGLALFNLGQSDDALAALEAAAAAIPFTSDVNAHVATYTLLGRVHQQRGTISEGVHWLEQALPLLPEARLAIQAELLNVLAMQYAITGDNATAERYFIQARTAFAEDQDVPGEANVILNLGLLAEQTGDLATATTYWLQADSLAALLDDTALQLRVAVNLGSSYIDQGHYDDALPLLTNAALLATAAGDVWNQCFVVIKRARALHGLGRYREALPFLQEGNRLALALESLSLRGEAVQLLKDTYAQLGQFDEAYRYSLAYDSLTEAFFTEENQRILQELEAEQKAAQISTLEQQQAVDQARIRQQRLLIGGVVVIALLLAWLALLYVRRSREQATQAEQLRQLDRAKSRFFANISHELRTPLTLILSPLERALQNSGDGASSQNNLTLARKNGQQLLHLVEDILDLSKLDAGELTVTSAPVVVASLLRRMFFSFESLAQQRRVTLHDAISVAPTLAAELDVRKVEQILNNLLSNAIKYTPAGGQVTLTATQSNQTLTLTVRDTGRGIHPNDLPHVFDRYYQSEQTQAPVEGGTGIGLALTRRLVDLMGGTIRVTSTLDEGSTFTVTLPLVVTSMPAGSVSEEQVDLPADTSTAPSFRPAFVQAGKQARILLVEDHRDMSTYLADLLEPYYDVTCVYDGQEALDTLRTHSFDLITSDIMMPRMDGLTFLQHLKQNDTWRHTPFILLTARADEADKLEGWRLGVDDYITKPFNADELLARIDNLLRNQQEREAWNEAHDAEPEPLSAEQAFLQQAEQIVLDHLDQSSFTVPDLADHLGISERNLHRKTKALTGLTPLQFMREIRLQHAYRLLERKAFGTVAEVCYAVGFENPSYFARLFAKRFGQAPSKIIGRA